MIENSVREFANNPLLGSRVMTEEKVLGDDGNTTSKYHYLTNIAVTKAGKYEWMTYVEVYEKAKYLARAINSKELCPDITIDDKAYKMMGLYSRNRPEWCIADVACVLNSIVSIPLYDTLGDNSVSFIVNQTEMTSIAMGKDKIDNIIKVRFYILIYLA
jgi:long-subunit acyl-CoA synthetase (AMP-forming)